MSGALKVVPGLHAEPLTALRSAAQCGNSPGLFERLAASRAGCLRGR
jgi:hypothetical protein